MDNLEVFNMKEGLKKYRTLTEDMNFDVAHAKCKKTPQTSQSDISI
jgi:hypothetical protein